MRTNITRTITVNKIHVAQITFENGTPLAKPLPCIETYGNITQEHANKLVKKQYGKNANVVVAKIETVDKFFSISVDDFIKYATPVENPEPDEE